MTPWKGFEMPRLRWIEVEGFRAFGASPQRLELSGDLALIWGPNSQGKTSLSEAIEFLLSGRTARRDLLASATREFANALRNAHLPDDAHVRVRAEILDNGGATHQVERTLKADYTAQDTCRSELTVDGAVAEDLASLGIRLSQPPLEVPVLMQHSLRYLLSAQPRQRAEYFKALLDLVDLGELRSIVADAAHGLTPTLSEHFQVLEQLAAQAAFSADLAPLLDSAPSAAVVETAIASALGTLLDGEESTPATLDERLSDAQARLAERRESVFPIDALEAGPEITFKDIPTETWEAFQDFRSAASRIEETTVRLSAVFVAVLNLPDVATASSAIDCPVCETPVALTPERLDAIRAQLDASTEFREAQAAVRDSLQQISSLVSATRTAARGAVPRFLQWSEDEKRDEALDEVLLEDLLGDEAARLLSLWRDASSILEKAVVATIDAADAVRKAITELPTATCPPEAVDRIRSSLQHLRSRVEALRQSHAGYLAAHQRLSTPLEAEVDHRSRAQHWAPLLHLAENREALLEDLCQRSACAAVRSEAEEALEQIDVAMTTVLDDRFRSLSDDVVDWWNLLRPDEPSCFDGIKRAGSGRRYIDLKASLKPASAGEGQAQLRDAIAVFSDSQLNALGLAAFLARADREGVGFVILDDPVPASDEEHRAMFVHRVLEQLTARGLQVVILTHDQRLWRDAQVAHSEKRLDTFVVTLEDPPDGARIQRRSDTLDALLARAKPYVGNSNPDIRKLGAERLRDAAERFCKLLLVEQRRGGGDTTASLSDYDGKSLADLVPKVEPLLDKDPSHPGKVRILAAYLNPGKHDDTVPVAGDLKVCYGNLKAFRKEYLS